MTIYRWSIFMTIYRWSTLMTIYKWSTLMNRDRCVQFSYVNDHISMVPVQINDTKIYAQEVMIFLHAITKSNVDVAILLLLSVAVTVTGIVPAC